MSDSIRFYIGRHFKAMAEFSQFRARQDRPGLWRPFADLDRPGPLHSAVEGVSHRDFYKDAENLRLIGRLMLTSPNLNPGLTKLLSYGVHMRRSHYNDIYLPPNAHLVDYIQAVTSL